MVLLQSLEQGQAFRLPWRKAGTDCGRLLYAGQGSAYVRIPHPDGDGWEETHIALNTEVEPVETQEYLTQAAGSPDKDTRERSTVEKPVKLVHRLCDEMEGASRNEIIAACMEQGVNRNTALTQYYAWRRKHK